MDRPKAVLAVMDGVGCGLNPDMEPRDPRDKGANSLFHASQISRGGAPLDARAFLEMGLAQIPGMERIETTIRVARKEMAGACAAIYSDREDNGSEGGHQHLMGHRDRTPFMFFPNGFPQALIQKTQEVLSRVLGRQVEVIRYPGKDTISGTDFIRDVGKEIWTPDDKVLRIGAYTSSDSVLQIAMHQARTPQELIKEVGEIVRKQVLVEEFGRVARVIMRPFTGEPGSFKRVESDRIDFGIPPDGPTLIDDLKEAGIPVFALGKVAEMFANQGFDLGKVRKMKTDEERLQAILEWMLDHDTWGLLFVNLKNTDEKHGHRRLPKEYVQDIIKIAEVMALIKMQMKKVGGKKLLAVTSDHGNDPTHKFCADNPTKPHTDHTQENVPFMAYIPSMNDLTELGFLNSFADVAATLAEYFGLKWTREDGKSFLPAITK